MYLYLQCILNTRWRPRMIWECANLCLEKIFYQWRLCITSGSSWKIQIAWQSLFLWNSKDLILSTIIEGAVHHVDIAIGINCLSLIYYDYYLQIAIRNANGITMSYKYFFITQPSCWNSFSSQHPLCPYSSSSTVANFNNCYWIPADLFKIYNAVITMMSLE